MTYAITTDGSWKRHLALALDVDEPQAPERLSRRTATLAGLLRAEPDAPSESRARNGAALVAVPAAEQRETVLGVEALGARLDWSDARAIMRIGALATPLEILVEATPGRVDALRAFDRARIALERGEPQRALSLATVAIDGGPKRRGDRHEHRFLTLRGLVRLGLARPVASLDTAPEDTLDIEGAYADLAAAARASWDVYDGLCIDEAKPAILDAAEIDYLLTELCAAWAAYCNGDLEACQAHAKRAVAQHAGLARGHYLIAKARAARGDAEGALAAAARAIGADEGFAPMIAADGDFRDLDAELGDLLHALGERADMLLTRFEAARRHVEKALKGGPVQPPLSLRAPRAPLGPDVSAPARLGFMKRFASELWSFMADFENTLYEETPKLQAQIQARRGARSLLRRRLAKRALVAGGICVLIGALVGRGLGAALDWLRPDMPDMVARFGQFVVFAGVALLAHQVWKRLRDDQRSARADSPLERRRAWVSRARIELNKGFDILNGAFKAPKNVVFFPDTTSMFRVHLGGPTHLDRAEGRIE